MPQKEQENKVKNKKSPTLWEFIKYIGLGVLAFFLIAAIIFQAPWKLTSLLLIFTIAAALLPKPYKKWFWMATAVVVLTLIIWIIIPESRTWKPYNLNLTKELNLLNRKFALSENENAAVLYEKLIQNQTQNYSEASPPNSKLLYRTAIGKPWKTKQFPQLSNWLKKQHKTIDAFITASKKKNCYYKIGKNHLVNYSDFLPPHTKFHRYWFCLLSCAANNDLAENRIDKALQKQTALLASSKHLRQQPFASDFLAGLSLEIDILKNINEFLVNGNPGKIHLNKLDNTLRQINHNWKNAWGKILQFETIKKKNSLFCTLYEINITGKIRRKRKQSLGAALGIGFPKKSFSARKLAKAESIIYWFFIPGKPISTGKIINQTLNEYSNTKNLYHQNHDYPNLLSDIPRINLSYLIKLPYNRIVKHYYDVFIRTKSFKKAAEIIIALRRYKNKHGHWPQKLQNLKHLLPQISLIDPLNNSAYGYKRTDENFILYSKGKNNIDEDAKGNFYSSSGPDDLPIWPEKQ